MYTTIWWESGIDHSTDPPRPTFTQQIEGPKGTVEGTGFVWCTDRADYVETLYWSMIDVLEGAYHCCLTGNVIFR